MGRSFLLLKVLAGFLILPANIFAGTAPPALLKTVSAASCLQPDVQTAVNAASNGDTVTIPSCPSGAQWASELNVTKAITLQGSPCMLDSKQRPASCGTVIIDSGADQNAIIKFTLVANQVTRLSNIEIRDGGRRPAGGATAVISVQGQSGGGAQDNRRFRLDHSRFIQLGGLAPSIQTAWGVLDHNYYELKSGAYFAVYFYQPADFDYADARWAEPTNWGSDKFLFLENNTFTRPAGSPHYALIDAYGGARYVARFNDITASWLEAHGTESSGRARGTRAVEAYKNNFTGTSGGANLVNIRSGPVLTWGNSSTGYLGAPKASNLNNERTLGVTVFGIADGTNPWDANRSDSATFTASSNSTPVSDLSQTVRVAGAGWTPNQWRGYNIHKSGCVSPDSSQPCGLLVFSNNADTISYGVDRPSTHLDIAVGNQFTLHRIDHVLDGPCRSGGTQLTYRFTSSITFSGKTATVTLSGHGFSTGNYVSIWDTPDPYRGTFQITVTGANTFTLTLGSTPNAPSTFASVTKVPANWNNQTTDPCYQWLNTESGKNLLFGSEPYNLQIRANEQYYDYEPSKPFDGSIGSNKSSVGVGPIANRPATCTAGVGYWATDEADWDSTHAGPDGRLYKCSATNMWSLIYTPATYPLPLATTP